MSQFSTNETVSLDKTVGNVENIKKTNNHMELYGKYQIENCIKWINENIFERVCLQFPNNYLPDATAVILEIEKQIGKKLYLLADTAYESCCIDYVAAKHINADAIIHFGMSCHSQLLENEIPVLRINPQYLLDNEKLIDNLRNFATDHLDSDCIYFVSNERYQHLIDTLFNTFDTSSNLNKIKYVDIDDFKKEYAQFPVVYFGDEDREIANFQYFYQVEQLFICNVNDKNLKIKQFTSNNRAFKRRNYLIEMIKDANTIGIIVGTLAVRNYLKILDRIQQLCKIHKKKYYILCVGKPNVAKLANFPEIDIFVIIACPSNEIYDSREFYKPIVTPYDIEMALNTTSSIDLLNIFNPYDYNQINLNDELINNEILLENGDVSLISGKLRGNCNVDVDENIENQQEITLRNDMKIAESNYGAGYLGNRSWQGLEQKLGETEPKLAIKGRTGLAKGYQNENH